MSDGGPTYGDLSNAINELRREFDRKLEREVARIEAEMREVGAMIVHAIGVQTDAVIASNGATTAAIVANSAVVESTRQQIESDFDKTRAKIDAQIESTLQIEAGKKLGEANSIRDKIDAFVGDIKQRFDRAIFSSAQNRELYNVAFRNIIDDHDAKVRTIGAHIFQIRMEDIAPAFKAAAIPYEEAHTLPLEMDMRRLELRSAQLDQTLELLRSSRLDDAASALNTLERNLAELEVRSGGVQDGDEYSVEAISVRSTAGASVVVGSTALPVTNGTNVNLGPAPAGLELYRGYSIDGGAAARPATADEVGRLKLAAERLMTRGFISGQAHQLLDSFLSSGSLRSGVA